MLTLSPRPCAAKSLGCLTTLELSGCALLHAKAEVNGVALGVEGGPAPLEAQMLTAQEVEQAVTPLRQLRHLTLGGDFDLHSLSSLQQALAGMPSLEAASLTLAGCIRMQLPGGATSRQPDNCDDDDDGAFEGHPGFMGMGGGPMPGGMFMGPASGFMGQLPGGIFIG